MRRFPPDNLSAVWRFSSRSRLAGVPAGDAKASNSAPVPLLKAAHPVDWRFVFEVQRAFSAGQESQIGVTDFRGHPKALADLGVKSKSTRYDRPAIERSALISRPSKLNVPPWRWSRRPLGGVPLRTATWWATADLVDHGIDQADFLEHELGQPGAVEVATTGPWNGKEFGLTGE